MNPILLKQLETLKILTFAVKTFFIVFFFCCLAGLAAVFFWRYETFTYALLEAYGKTDKLKIFQSGYLSAEKYILLRIVLVLLLFFLMGILLKLSVFSRWLAVKILSLIHSCGLFLNELAEHYRNLSLSEKRLGFFVLIVIGSVKWFFLERYFFHIDEIFSYLFFVKKGFFVTVSYYPGPNNHVLYTLIAYVLQPFFSDPFYLMKVPAYVISLLASAMFFLFVLRHFEFRLAVIGTLLFSFSGHLFFYSLFGRGYVLMTLFVMIAAYAVLEIISGRNEKFLWHIYVVSCLLGFYSMIIYVYPYVSFSFALAGTIVYQKKYKQLKELLYYNAIIVLSVFLLYSPILLVSGLSSLIANPWIIRLGWLDFLAVLPSLIENLFSYITDLDKGGTFMGIAILGFTVFILVKRKKQAFLILLLSLFLAPAVVLLFQRVQPFERVWTYLIFPFSLCLVVVLDVLFLKIASRKYVKGMLAAILSFAFTGYTIYYFNESTRYGHQIYDEVDRICREAVLEGNGKIYTNEDVYNIYLRYESSRVGKDLVPEMDGAAGPVAYSHIMLVPGSSFPSSADRNKYSIKEQNESIEVYQLKE